MLLQVLQRSRPSVRCTRDGSSLVSPVGTSRGRTIRRHPSTTSFASAPSLIAVDRFAARPKPCTRPSHAPYGARIQFVRGRLINMIGRHLLVAALAGFAVLKAHAAFAGSADFEFQPVSAEIKSGPGSELAVRLIDKRTGKGVPGA